MVEEAADKAKQADLRSGSSLQQASGNGPQEAQRAFPIADRRNHESRMIPPSRGDWIRTSDPLTPSQVR
jgi:hypothetical protein